MEAFISLSASVPVRIKEQVQALAKARGWSERKIVLLAIEQYLAREAVSTQRDLARQTDGKLQTDRTN